MIPIDHCDETCGILFALAGALCYGTSNVPIKAKSSVEIHPLITQSYKTAMVFAISLFVVSVTEWPSLTWYGLLSGHLWFFGGAFGVVAVGSIGIATSVGIWSTIMVIMNFVWGILVFHEPMHSLFSTCAAFVFLASGLVGMLKFSSPNLETSDEGNVHKEYELNNSSDPEEVILVAKSEVGSELDQRLQSRGKRGIGMEKEITETVRGPTDTTNDDRLYNTVRLTEEICSRRTIHSLFRDFGRSIGRKKGGAICASLNGLLSGSSLVPLHYAKAAGYSDMSYYFSFTSGAVLANTISWILFYLFCSLNRSKITSIPQWHMKELGPRLLLTGILSHGGMLGSIMATSTLGQAVGNSLIQLKIFISGLWGIFYFKETKGREYTINWFLSATMCVNSILCLTYERKVMLSSGHT